MEIWFFSPRICFFSGIGIFSIPPLTINTPASKMFILFLRVVSHFKGYFYFGSTKCLHSRLTGIKGKLLPELWLGTSGLEALGTRAARPLWNCLRPINSVNALFSTWSSLLHCAKGTKPLNVIFVLLFKDTRANCDPDKLLQCPFDNNHHIRAKRFPYHLTKCRKVSWELVKCYLMPRFSFKPGFHSFD